MEAQQGDRVIVNDNVSATGHAQPGVEWNMTYCNLPSLRFMSQKNKLATWRPANARAFIYDMVEELIWPRPVFRHSGNDIREPVRRRNRRPRADMTLC